MRGSYSCVILSNRWNQTGQFCYRYMCIFRTHVRSIADTLSTRRQSVNQSLFSHPQSSSCTHDLPIHPRLYADVSWWLNQVHTCVCECKHTRIPTRLYARSSSAQIVTSGSGRVAAEYSVLKKVFHRATKRAEYL